MDLLPLARQALAQNQLDRAIQLLLTASSKQPESPDIWFTLATALGRKGGQQAPCCIAYLRTLQLLLADGGAMQGPARAAVAAVAADNCWLLAEKLLPTAWPAALQDPQLASSIYQGLMHHLTLLLQQQQQQSQQQHQGLVSTQTAPDTDASGAGRAVCSHVQLLCVGGMGVQAMLLAAAASAAQGSAVEAAEAAAASAGANSSSSSDACVPSMGLTCIPDGQLTAHIVSQLLLDNDLDDIVDVCTWPEYMQQQREQPRAAGVLALLAGAVQPNWGPAVSSCLKACHRLAAFTAATTSGSSSGGRGSSIPCVLSPGVIKVWAVPVSCKELLELNEVDLPALSAHTAGHYNYAAANAALRRSSRAAQVSRHNPQLLAAPSLVLELSLQELLQQLQQRYSAPQQKQQAAPAHEAPRTDSREGLAGACVAAALAAGRPAEVTTVVKVQQAGRVDAVVWWLEFDWAPGHGMAFTPSAAAAACAAAPGATCGAQPDGVSSHSRSADVSSSSSGDSTLKAACVGSSSAAGVLQPHVWQHVQYLPADTTAAAAAPGRRKTAVTQGQGVVTGDTLLLHARATADDLVLSLSLAGSSETAAAPAGGAQLQQTCTEQQQQQQQGQPVAEPGRDILPYHLSMLNDHPRTVAYDRGIAGAVQQLLSQQEQQQGQGEVSRPALAAPVVLDVGCGTGLLSMMATTAAAAAGGSVTVTGCEREPVLAGVASALIVDNHLQQAITVVQKLSNKLTVADGSTPSAAAATGRSSKSSGQSGKKQQQQQYTTDMPAKASLIVHEIFGTDPLSEHVLPALQQVQQQLAQPGACFMPSRLRIIAAVAACPALLTHLRIAATATQQPQLQSDQSAGGELPAWDLSSLLALQPRKLELQLDELQDKMLLLTAPQPVLELDFQQPIQLNGKQVVELPALQQPLLLGHWMQQQQQGSAGSITIAGIKPAAGSHVQCQGSQWLRECVVVSWFEADCGAGGWLSTRPGTTQLGHWQQSVEFVGLAAAAAASRSLTSSSGGSKPQHGNVNRSAPASFRLQASWSNDRVKFSLLEHS